MLSSLTKKESELKVLLEKQQKQAAQLNKKVDDMIAAEIAAAERRAKAKADAEKEKQNKNRLLLQNHPTANHQPLLPLLQVFL